MLILMDSLFTDIRTQFSNTIFKWFESSKDAKQNHLYLTLKTINLPDAVRQSDLLVVQISSVFILMLQESCR